jgi:DNA end-binding protein Ku
VRKPEPVEVKGELRKAELDMAKSLVENLSEPFEPEKYDDTYRKELLELLRAKAEGTELPEAAEDGGGEVVDLMAALRESVERTKKSRAKAKKPARAAKSKRAAAR